MRNSYAYMSHEWKGPSRNFHLNYICYKYWLTINKNIWKKILSSCSHTLYQDEINVLVSFCYLLYTTSCLDLLWFTLLVTSKQLEFPCLIMYFNNDSSSVQVKIAVPYSVISDCSYFESYQEPWKKETHDER